MKTIGERLAWVLVLLMAACSTTQPEHFYQLAVAPQVNANDSPDSGKHWRVAVAATDVPELVDRLPMVFQLTPNQVRISEEERWAEPLANAISRTLAADLAHRMPQSDIWLDGVGTPGRADLRVKLVVLQFAAVPGQHLDVQLRWAVANLGDRTDDRVLGQVHDYHEPLGSDGGEGLARALSRVVDQVSAEIAQALQHSQGTEGTH